MNTVRIFRLRAVEVTGIVCCSTRQDGDYSDKLLAHELRHPLHPALLAWTLLQSVEQLLAVIRSGQHGLTNEVAKLPGVGVVEATALPSEHSCE